MCEINWILTDTSPSSEQIFGIARNLAMQFNINISDLRDWVLCTSGIWRRIWEDLDAPLFEQKQTRVHGYFHWEADNKMINKSITVDDEWLQKKMIVAHVFFTSFVFQRLGTIVKENLRVGFAH